MNTMLAMTDTMTLTRIVVIGRRTNSALMAGAKAMMVENVKNQMRNGVAHFVYMKKSGELREAFGTTSKALVEYVKEHRLNRVVCLEISNLQSLFVPLTVVFSNLLLEGIERLWEVHAILPNSKHFPLAAEDSVS